MIRFTNGSLLTIMCNLVSRSVAIDGEDVNSRKDAELLLAAVNLPGGIQVKALCPS